MPIVFLAFVTLAGFAVGCASPQQMSHTSNGDQWDYHDQAQHAAALVALRYASILQDLYEGSTDKALKDADWWLDQTILSLAMLERDHPERHWANRTVSGDDSLMMKRVYKDIAIKRHKYPRLHGIPFDREELDLINAFIDEYK